MVTATRRLPAHGGICRSNRTNKRAFNSLGFSDLFRKGQCRNRTELERLAWETGMSYECAKSSNRDVRVITRAEGRQAGQTGFEDT
jgi:hypothetical protein